MRIETRYIKKAKNSFVVKEGERHLWSKFHEHHYMTAKEDIKESLPRSCKFFTFYWIKDNKEVLVGCIGVINQISRKPSRRFTRMVILPEYQGLSFSKTILNNLASMYLRKNIKMYLATFHPRIGSYCENSDQWSASNNNMIEHKKSNITTGDLKNVLRDGVAMFRYGYVGNENYSLVYNPIELTELKNRIKDSKEQDDELLKEYNKIIRLRNSKADYVLPSTLLKTDENHIKSKEEHNKLFNKSKRKVLSPEERKAKRKELKDKKNEN